jgi:hypothetical protein
MRVRNSEDFSGVTNTLVVLPLGTTLYYHGEEPNHIKTSLEEREEKK